MEKYSLLTKLAKCTLNIALKLTFSVFLFFFVFWLHFRPPRHCLRPFFERQLFTQMTVGFLWRFLLLVKSYNTESLKCFWKMFKVREFRHGIFGGSFLVEGFLGTVGSPTRDGLGFGFPSHFFIPVTWNSEYPLPSGHSNFHSRPPLRSEHPRRGGGYSHTLPIRVCAAQRGRDFEAPDLERGIHFRGVF